MSKALYIMIGGFLGAGKTTAVLQFARRFRAEGKRAGLITNDQSFGLVDTAMLSSHGFDVEEIEDIRLAIEELCLAAFEGRGSGRLHLRLGFRANALEIDCRFEPDTDDTDVVNSRSELATQLTEQLLSALADEHGIEVDSGESRAWFRKLHHDPPVE